MTIPPQSRLRISFGPFEVHAATGELRRRGIHVRLSGQPFQLLLALLSRPGELVTREQLRNQIWPDGTFVDFEGGLNAAMNKLRRALNDSADNPLPFGLLRPNLPAHFRGWTNNPSGSGGD
jgi:DNA-binding winged helix-turn-helix (wHTH) protein